MARGTSVFKTSLTLFFLLAASVPPTSHAAGPESLVTPFEVDVKVLLSDKPSLPPVAPASGKAVMAAPAAKPPVEVGQTFKGKVTYVSDADTISVKYKTDITVRLEAVDAPETAHPQYNKPAQPYGDEAHAFVRGLAEGKTVTVKVSAIDDYGRVVGWVTLPGGGSLQERMLSEGWAWWNFYYNHDQALNNLENEAMRAGRGLWAGKQLGGEYTPEAPWVFRRRVEAKMDRVLPGQEFALDVARLPDADTLARGTSNSVYDYVRLAAVDAPEVSHGASKPGQPYGKEAGARATELIAAEGNKVVLKVEDVDSYGRIIAWVWLPKRGAYLNEILVEEGWAWWYQGYYPGLTELGKKQDAARAARRGLWADPNPPIAPWDFRASQRPKS